MAQNTSQDVSEEIIDLVEIIQKGKVPRPREDAQINFDQAFSDLQGTSANAIPDNPMLEDLLSGLETPVDAPAPSRAEPPAPPDAPASLDDLLADLGMPGAMPGSTPDSIPGSEPAPAAAQVAAGADMASPNNAAGQSDGSGMPDVPSFESLFADLGLSPDSAASSGASAQPVPKAAPAPQAAPVAPEEPDGPEFGESLANIPGFDDVDALIKKLDVPPSGTARKSTAPMPDAGSLLDDLDGKGGAPADLDSLLDSLLTAGGPRTPHAKTAQGQPKNISEEDLDDLLSSIEVESGGKPATTAPAAMAAPQSATLAEADNALHLADVSPAHGPGLAPAPEPETPLPADATASGATPAAPVADGIDELFRALDAEAKSASAPAASVPPASSADAMSDADLDALLNGLAQPAPESMVPESMATENITPEDVRPEDSTPDKPAPETTADQPQAENPAPAPQAGNSELSPGDLGDLDDLDDLLGSVTVPPVQMTPAAPPVQEAAPQSVPQASAQTSTPTPTPNAGSPSLADLLSGKADLDLPDDLNADGPDALNALPGFEDEATPESNAEQETPSADSQTVTLVEDLTPADVLADVDALIGETAVAATAPTAVAATAPADVAATVATDVAVSPQDQVAATVPGEPAVAAEPMAASTAGIPAVTSFIPAGLYAEAERLEEVELRLSMLEAELTLLQNRVDALETATESEQLQDKVLDALSDNTPLRVQLLDLVQAEVQQSVAARDEKAHKSQADIEARIKALAERLGDAEWGREEGLSMQEKRLTEMEQRLDASARLEALEARLAVLEQPAAADNLEERVSLLETLPVEALEERVAVLENRPDEGLSQRIEQLEQHMQRLNAESPEEKARQLVELMRADIERAAAESAARILREEIAALLSE